MLREIKHNITNKICFRLVLKNIIFFFLIVFSFSLYATNPLSKNANSINSGLKLYQKRCSNCHGANAEGKENGFFLSPNLKTFDKGYKSFLNILINGYGRMPAWGGRSKLTKEQLNQLASYLEHLASDSANWK